VLPPAPRGAQPATYFDIFGLAPRFGVDEAALEKEFYRLSRRLHPDRYAAAPPAEQQASLAASSLLNDAYRTLRSPLRRVEYLLRLEGVLEPGGDAPGAVGSRPAAPPPRDLPAGLLEEVFELNMQIEEMRAGRERGENDAGLRTALEAAREQFAARMAELDGALAEHGRRWDLEPASPAARAELRAMAALLDRRRYLGNLVRDVEGALAS
jgi:molecular chaperone HscB